ncbi:Flp family type IVb pilin [Paraburkholderia acidicola]|uniref:Flp family type IVb pilin n=1 Tax=Paraburkholderia acidicola TaxID=1912599 RepID=A0ABV1LFR4_9BURK
MKKFTKFLRENKGVTALEYGLIAGLIVVAVGVAVTPIRAALNVTFGNVVAALNNANGG